MRKSRFTEAQIVEILTEQEAGLATMAVCRRHGTSSATFCKKLCRLYRKEGLPLRQRQGRK